MGKYRNESIRLKNWDYGRQGAYFITICTQNHTHYFGEIEHGKMQVSPAGAIAHVLWQEIKHHTKNIELGEFVVMPNHIHGILIINEKIGIDDGLDNIGGDDFYGNFIGRIVACNDPTENRRDVACNVRTNLDDFGGDDGMGIIGGDDFDRDDGIVDIDGNFIGRIVACNDPTENRRDVVCNVPTNLDDFGGDDIGGDDIGGDYFIHKNEKMAAISPKSNTVSTIIRSYKSAVSKYCNRLGLEFEWQSRFYDHIIKDDAAFSRISNYIKNNPANWKEDAL